MKVLKTRILDTIQQAHDSKLAADRKQQVGSGDRSERIRTYNYPQNRISDHRTGLTLYKLEQVMEGNLEEVFDNMSTHFNAERLKELNY